MKYKIFTWGDIDHEDYGVCSKCRKELYCCSCYGDIIMKPTIEQLNESWDSFLKEGIYLDQRYGQWHYNLYKHEVGNSYNIERPYTAYQVLYEDIVTNCDIEESK